MYFLNENENLADILNNAKPPPINWHHCLFNINLTIIILQLIVKDITITKKSINGPYP